jgi:hypothetical protein
MKAIIDVVGSQPLAVLCVAEMLIADPTASPSVGIVIVTAQGLDAPPSELESELASAILSWPPSEPGGAGAAFEGERPLQEARAAAKIAVTPSRCKGRMCGSGATSVPRHRTGILAPRALFTLPAGTPGVAPAATLSRRAPHEARAD